MPEHIGELLHRNLQEVFGEGNAARRRAAIESLYTSHSREIRLIIWLDPIP
jgi:hypothetical protein